MFAGQLLLLTNTHTRQANRKRASQAICSSIPVVADHATLLSEDELSHFDSPSTVLLSSAGTQIDLIWRICVSISIEVIEGIAQQKSELKFRSIRLLEIVLAWQARFVIVRALFRTLAAAVPRHSCQAADHCLPPDRSRSKNSDFGRQQKMGWPALRELILAMCWM